MSLGKVISMKFVWRLVIAALLLCLGFTGGIMVGRSDPATAQDEKEFPLLEETVGYIEEFFVKDKPTDKELEYAVVRAYLQSLNDPYTFFIEPAVAASESDALAGRYGGIGVDVQRNEQGEFVLYPFEDSPASRAGILEGDIILAINDTPVDLTSSMDTIRQALRGEIKEGAGVKLVVRNIDSSEERDYFIAFEEILVPSVTWRTLFEAPEIGYLKISSFTSRTPDEFILAINELREQNIQALVLDLRGNSGGLLQESLTISGQFLERGVISIERRVTGESTLTDEAGGVMTDLPLVVLVNTQTASASEIVAGAIQDNERGILIGQITYGKGSIQRIFPLSDTSSIHVSTALWLTPDGKTLDGQGLTPDIAMIPDENGRDVELGEAIRYLRQQIQG